MIRYFTLNNKHNKLYAEIGETVKQYYPIGTERETLEYNEYAGIKKLMDIVEENMTRNREFYKPWREFLIKLRSGSIKKIHNSSLPSEYSFSGELILERYQDKSLRRIKKLIFSVSLIGPFFSLFGVDETFIKEDDNELASGYHAINVITESPFKEFEESFNYLQSEIEKQFTNYKLVPVRICLFTVMGLHTPYGSLDECKVHNALFNSYFDLNHVQFFRGELYYGGDSSNITVD